MFSTTSGLGLASHAGTESGIRDSAHVEAAVAGQETAGRLEPCPLTLTGANAGRAVLHVAVDNRQATAFLTIIKYNGLSGYRARVSQAWAGVRSAG
jgi:hypothetical protein